MPTSATKPSVRLSTSAIVKVAAQIADTEGVDAVTLSRVARELDVRQPALYRYVDGIHELRKVLALQARTMLAASLTEAAVGRSRGDAIAAVAGAWRTFVKTHPGLYTVTDRVATVGDVELEASVDSVVNVLALALSGFALGPTETVHAARSLRSALHGFAVLEKDAGHPSHVGLDESYDRLVNLLVAGVGAMST
jgi:AcrR family transcriptional regulator